MALHLGNIVRKRLEELGMNKSELARRINCTPQNIYNIFKRDSIDIKMLDLLSKALSFDFIRYYREGKGGYDYVSGNKEAGDAKIAKLERQVEKYKNLYENSELDRQHIAKEFKLLSEINDLLREKLANQQG